MAPVAMVFARRAIATFPPLRRSPIIPEPTTAASGRAVPIPSTASLRARLMDSHGASARGGRFRGANKGAHELPFHLGSDSVHIDPFSSEKRPSVFNAV